MSKGMDPVGRGGGARAWAIGEVLKRVGGARERQAEDTAAICSPL